MVVDLPVMAAFTASFAAAVLADADLNPVLNEVWFLTVDPLIWVSVFIAKLP